MARENMTRPKPLRIKLGPEAARLFMAVCFRLYENNRDAIPPLAVIVFYEFLYKNEKHRWASDQVSIVCHPPAAMVLSVLIPANPAASEAERETLQTILGRIAPYVTDKKWLR